MRQRKKRLEQIHMNWIENSSKQLSESAISKSYVEELELALPFVSTDCELSELPFCERSPTYPFFILGWDMLRKFGLSKELRLQSYQIAGLCKQCTLLMLPLIGSWHRSVSKLVSGSYDEKAELFKSMQLKGAVKLDDKRGKIIELIDKHEACIVEKKLYLNLDVAFIDELVGELVRYSTDYETGELTLIFHRNPCVL